MIYADNAATTAVHPSVLAAMLPYFGELYGNPGAQHGPGRAAAEAVAAARADVAGCMGCSPSEVVFCASGSEADNQALRTAAAWGRAHGRDHVVTTAFEHPAILRTCEALGREGFSVTRVDPDGNGIVEADAIRAAVLPGRTCLVSVMTVNNEVGTLQPVAEIAAAAHEAGALFHTDAVQGAGHVPLDMEGMGIDMLSLSAHKFHGPKGVGALLCRSDAFGEKIEVVRVIHGGGQERGRRAGTENVPGIVGLACALREACGHLEERAHLAGSLRDRLIEGLLGIDGAHLVGDRLRRNPGTVNVAFEGVNREALVVALDQAGICASAGAACESGAVGISPVLRSMGIPAHVAAGALRLSVNADNTPDEVETIIREVGAAVARLRSIASEKL